MKTLLVTVLLGIVGCDTGKRSGVQAAQEAEAEEKATGLSKEPSSTTDWPRWRGPKADGVADGRNLPVRWTQTENVRWSVKLPGWGASSPVVRGNRVFVTSQLEKDGKKSLLTLCFDRQTGKELWRHDFGLPRLYCWLEIKGEKPTDEEKRLCRELADATYNPVAIAWGLPRTPKCEQVYHHGLKSWKGEYTAEGLWVYCIDQLASMTDWDGCFWAMDEDNNLCICSNEDHFEKEFYAPFCWHPFLAMKLIQEIKSPISEKNTRQQGEECEIRV